MDQAQRTPSGHQAEDAASIAQIRLNWRLEASGGEKFRRLAQLEKHNEERRKALLDMAKAEARHASYWAERLKHLGVTVPTLKLPLEDRITLLVARMFGVRSALYLLRSRERLEIHNYQEQAHGNAPAETKAIIARIMPEELLHLERLSALAGDRGTWSGYAVGTRGMAMERWHTSGASVRNFIFGINDGLVSIVSLVSGVAGATTDNTVVVVAGLAGLVAGAVSMTAGAYISVKSQAEVLSEEMRKEEEEIESHPEEERAELKAIYRAKGFTPEEVEILVNRLTSTKERWLRTLAREELGLGEESFEDPRRAGMLAGVAFSLGGIVPVLPYFFADGVESLVPSIIASLIALFAVGALKSLATGRRWVRSGLEMVLVGGFAAGFTYLIGRLFQVEGIS
ncbi:MAG: VIT1/CCC1 transporter family protein [Chloroflexi bacterium]|nr:VIT1/CCC1 transporter family protein [Chloroflexota bacterium]